MTEQGSPSVKGQEQSEAEAQAAGSSETEQREQVGADLVKRFALWSGVAGLVPFPGIDVLAVGGLQLQMLRRLSQVYDVAFSANRGKALIASLAGSLIPATSGIGAASALKAVPLLGTVVSGLCHAGVIGGGDLRHWQDVYSAFQVWRHAARLQCAGLSGVRAGAEGNVGLCAARPKRRERTLPEARRRAPRRARRRARWRPARRRRGLELPMASMCRRAVLRMV